MLPFHVSGMFGLKSKTHGIALVNEQGIKLVFRDAAELKEDPDEDAESMVIAWDNLASWKADRGLIADGIKFHVRVMIGDEPDGKNDNVIELEVSRLNREKLDRFEKLVKDYQSGHRKDDVDDVLDDVRDMLDRM